MFGLDTDMHRRRAIFLGATICALGPLCAAELPASEIAVLYPEMGQPYLGVFLSIVSGIESQLGGKVFAMPVTGGSSSSDLDRELSRRETKVLIALGRNGLRMASQLDKSRPVLGGGVISVAEEQSRVWPIQSLTPDPAMLLARLRSLLPLTRRVVVVYEPKQSEWLIRLAKEAAKSMGMEIMSAVATDLKAAALAYREFFPKMDPLRDALWLLQDAGTVDDAVILPMVLEECWSRRLPLLSNNPGHVRKGALFALYADNHAMGRGLGKQALELAKGGGQALAPGLRTLKELNWAINTRTAGHVGVRGDVLRLGADLMFPES